MLNVSRYGRRRGRRRCVAVFCPITETIWPSDQSIVPIKEVALAQNHDLIDAIVNAKVSGQVMSPDEFKAWLGQQ